ncbi:GSCOCG00002174001-RA-CDS [Cotesia congregata]|nr:GSCOCG00002174001-RA-CDS [Cotesia congregata]
MITSESPIENTIEDTNSTDEATTASNDLASNATAESTANSTAASSAKTTDKSAEDTTSEPTANVTAPSLTEAKTSPSADSGIDEVTLTADSIVEHKTSKSHATVIPTTPSDHSTAEDTDSTAIEKKTKESIYKAINDRLLNHMSAFKFDFYQTAADKQAALSLSKNETDSLADNSTASNSTDTNNSTLSNNSTAESSTLEADSSTAGPDLSSATAVSNTTADSNSTATSEGSDSSATTGALSSTASPDESSTGASSGDLTGSTKSASDADNSTASNSNADATSAAAATASSNSSSNTTQDESTSFEKSTDLATEMEAHPTTLAANSSPQSSDHSLQYKYVVVDPKTKIPCVLMSAVMNLDVHYEMANHTMANGSMTIPPTAQVEGTCSYTDAMMILKWKNEKLSKSKRDVDSDETGMNSVVFNFVSKDSKAYLDNIEANIYLDNATFPYALKATLKEKSIERLSLFEANISTEYLICDERTDVHTPNITLSMKNVALIAFNTKEDLALRKAHVCGNEVTVNVGAIIGGLTAAIVIICVILYFISKKSKRTSANLP